MPAARTWRPYNYGVNIIDHYFGMGSGGFLSAGFVFAS